jgi:hypothetical protein
MKPILSLFALAVMLCLMILQAPQATVSAAASQSQFVDLPSSFDLQQSIDALSLRLDSLEAKCEACVSCNCDQPQATTQPVSTPADEPIEYMQVCEDGVCTFVPVPVSGGTESVASSCEDGSCVAGPVANAAMALRNRQFKPVRNLISRFRNR